MLPIERHRYITEILSQHGRILVNELALGCQVSRETIRRDLVQLELQGVLLRSHGGAVHIQTAIAQTEGKQVISEIVQGESFRKRSAEHPDQKARIAKRALSFIKAGECILLDSSTSSWFLARQIPDIELVVLTNSLHIIQTLACKENIRVIGLGGEFSAKYEDFVGILAEKILKDFVINTLFFSCHGLSLEGGMRESNEHHARLKQQMLQASERKILLVDSSKFGRRSFVRICHYHDIDVVITDQLADEEFRQELAWNNVLVIVVPATTTGKSYAT
ncbi:DeoR/GlpR family DNA-binding transcription regulator [Sodalis ligni]|jgi:DeoR family L-fucose operon activator|uniref:DeoR family transcriptional regulator n=1 Tax=Sodalis ligni TaxID=2697027 RepID=A0A4R1NDG5_9GAMM|nr:DeoR/GlpR family DNA-binding transcription regulator [Sodalis ligni]TCL05443.1 DeoR family transcriptional regulator [Sodalis ligni]